MSAADVRTDDELNPAESSSAIDLPVQNGTDAIVGPPTVARKRRRPKRSRPRKRTLRRLNRVTLREEAFFLRTEGVELYYDSLERPRTRAECPETRPCGWVSCRHNMYLDINPETGSITLNFPELEPHEIRPDRSCSLDIADRGPLTLDETGIYINLTRERIRQVEVKYLMKLKAHMDTLGVDALVQPGQACDEPQRDTGLNLTYFY